jgi:hypothetical protein
VRVRAAQFLVIVVGQARICSGSSTSPLGAVAPGRHPGYTGKVQADFVELTITVPASLADDNVAERARVLLILDAVRSERMTWRAAASALRIAPDELLDLARAHGVPIVRYEVRDLQDDLSTLAKLERRHASGA